MVLMYLRKSRADNPYETVEEVLSRHETILQEYAERKYGERIPESQIYREVVSGEKIETRPEMKAVLRRMEAPDVDAVLVVDPQRLSRGDLIDCGTLMQAFKYSYTKIETPMKVFDLWDKFDEKMIRDELMRGREYLEYAKEVMARGRKLSTSEGWYVSSIIPFGYDVDHVMDGKRRRKTLKPNPTESVIVQNIFDWFVNDKLSMYAISDRLNDAGIKTRKDKEFATDAVRGIIKNPVYIGKIAIGRRDTKENMVDGKVIKSRPRTEPKKIFDGRHPAIVSEEIFNAAQDRIGTLPKVKRSTEFRNPFCGIARCSCGRALAYNKGRGEVRLICGGRKKCGARSVTLDDFTSKVIKALKETASDFSVQIDSGIDIDIQRHAEETKQAEAMLKDLEVQQERLYSFLESGTYSEEIFRKRNAMLEEKKEKAQNHYEYLLDNEPVKIDYKKKVGTLHQAIDNIASDKLTPKQKNDFLKTIISKIIYTPLPPIDDGTRFGKHQYRLDIFLKD